MDECINKLDEVSFDSPTADKVLKDVMKLVRTPAASAAIVSVGAFSRLANLMRSLFAVELEDEVDETDEQSPVQSGVEHDGAVEVLSDGDRASGIPSKWAGTGLNEG